MTKKNRVQKKNPAKPTKPGCRIMLKTGNATRRKYNGREVRVMEYPSKGGWMTVDFRGHAMKWRKTGYFLESPEARKQRLTLERVMDQIRDKVWASIFSYLVGPSHDITLSENGHEAQDPRELISVDDAKHIHSTLISVCSRWRNTCDCNVAAIFGRMNADLDALPVAQVVPCMHWMIKHKVSIGALTFHADYGDILFLEKLLNACDTSKLTFLFAYIIATPKKSHHMYNDVGSNCSSQWICEASGATYDPLDLHEWHAFRNSDPNSWVTLQQMCTKLSVPYSPSPPKVQQLHNTIASNCRNISQLHVNIERKDQAKRRDYWFDNDLSDDPETEDHDIVSESLFSLDRLRKLGLSLRFVPGASSVIERVLEKLDDLEELSISCTRLGVNPTDCSSMGDMMRSIYDNAHTDDDVGRGTRVHIASKKVRVLNVSGLSDHHWISGDLPKLEKLIYGCFRGIVPKFTKEQSQTVVSINNRRDQYFFAGQASIQRMKLPPLCKVIAQGLHREVVIKSYHDDFEGVYSSFCNAKLV
jgi:hypothetical protein